MGIKIIRIDLENREFSVVSSVEGQIYLGGEVLSHFLLKEYLEKFENLKNYFSISTGPINGLFPYTSKSVILHLSKGLILNKYIGGGAIGALMNLSGVSTIEIIGDATSPIYLDITPKGVNFIELTNDINFKEFGLSGRRSYFSFKEKILCDGYFSYGKCKTEISNNLVGLTFSTQGEFLIPDQDAYWEVVNLINSKVNELSVTKSNSPSCFGCPLGCALSSAPESANISLLPRSLVSCAYAESVYNDIPLVFSCLSVLGYDYKHEFLELFSANGGEVIRKTYNIIEEIRVKNFITGLI